MPLDVLGCTRATLMRSTSLRSCLKWLGLLKRHRDGDRSLQLLIFNEELLASASHQLMLITSLPALCTHRPSLLPVDPVNTWADELSREKLGRFAHRPEERFRPNMAALMDSRPQVTLQKRVGATNAGASILLSQS